LFIIPSIPAALGNFLLPVMLGTKDVAFPRLNLGSFYLWVTGLVLFLTALSITGLDTGWTFYTPYSIETQKGGAVLAATFGVFVLGFSSIFTGLNFIVTINTMRPPGMTWFRMPLFLWATYATSIIQVLATPFSGSPCCYFPQSACWGLVFSIRSLTATRLHSSTSFGSTPTRPFTS